MNILINILVVVICIALGYLMGSANISIPLGKLFFKQDPRDYGSHNCGATNCGRIWGKKWFFIVFFFDVFKTVAPLYICWALLTYVPFYNGTVLLPKAIQMYTEDISSYVIQWPIYWTACIGSLLGNIFPLFTGFRGGKAASTYIGITVATCWAFAVLGLFTFFGTLIKSKFVSLSSMILGIENAIVSWVWAILLMLKVIPEKFLFIINWGPMFYFNYVYAIVMTILVIVMIIRHHENIGRLRAGTERKVRWLDRKKEVENQ